MELITKFFGLRNISLFTELEAETLLMIAEECELRNYPAGETIFLEGDEAEGLYCIYEGSVNIMRDQKIIATLKKEHYFGELALLDEGKRTATAIAVTDTSILFLGKNAFKRMTDDLPEILREVTRVVVRYLRANLERSVS